LWRNKPIDLQQTRTHLRATLANGGCESPGETGLILLGHALDRPKSWILSHGDYSLTYIENHTLQTGLTQLLQGVPLPYVLGHWDFYGRTFQITPDVLIPRPETELLIEYALQHAGAFQQPRVIDVGTGSGVIAVTLAAECPEATVLGVDLSMAALRVAHANAQRLCPSRVSFFQADLLAPFSTQFDLVCANLPYIPQHELDCLSVSQTEPRLALDGGVSGLDVINALLTQAQTQLSPTGVILLEIHASLGAETLAAAQAAFPNAQHQLIRDLAGLDRIVVIQRGNN
jgi:release factor glutamine methyltransferase